MPYKRVLESVLLLYAAALAARAMRLYVRWLSDDLFQFSQYLVNYSGGYVRRGMPGELIWQACAHGVSSPRLCLLLFTAVAFISVTVFFIILFRRRALCWYVLPLPVFLGAQFSLTSKDSLMMALFIAMTLLWRKGLHKAWRCLLFTLLWVFAINCHEGFGFFSIPLFLLLLLNDRQLSLPYKILPPATAVLAMLMTVLCHGDSAIAATIRQSWRDIAPTQFGTDTTCGISSLGWSLEFAASQHLSINFLTRSWGLYGWMVRPLEYLAIYYVLSQTIFVFSNRHNCLNANDKSNLSTLLLLQFCALLPMFTVLSCDHGRITLYWSLTSYAVFLLCPRPALSGLLPRWARREADKLNQFMEGLIKPTPSTMSLFLLFVGIRHIGFSVPCELLSSVIGYTLYFCYFIICHLLGWPQLIDINLL